MEQGQCWMKTKRKYSLSSNLITSPTNNPSYVDSSWEEQAFAEDAAAGSLGGCIWPPRSYSCTFCRREFRSAQALGGHMNVHRRDRARLKQPSSPQSEILCQNNPFTSLGYLNPSPVCGLVYNTNPNSDVDVLVSPSSPSPPNKALAPSFNDTCREKTLIPLYNSSIFHKTFQGFKLQTASPDVVTTSLPSQPHQTVKLILDGDHRLYSCKFHPEGNNIEKASKGLDLNLVVCRAHSPVQFETKEPDISCKKMKTEASSIQLFPKSSSVDRHHMQSKMFEFSPSSIEEVDLELRLGNNRSKV